ncbi:hypothetical protein [Streptomyces sp. TE5632]
MDAVVPLLVPPAVRPPAGGALLGTALSVSVLRPERWALFVAPDDERGAAAHARWTILLCAAGGAWTVCGAEPVRRS